MRPYLYIIPCLVLACGCSSSKHDKPLAEKERNLPSEAVSIEPTDSIEINEVFDLWTWTIQEKSVCFASSGDGDDTGHLIFMYNYPDAEKMYETGKIGQGPGEFITMNAGQAQNDDLLLYDIMGRKLRLYTTEADSIQMVKDFSLMSDEDGVCKPSTFISQLSSNTFLMKLEDAETSSWEIANLETGEMLDSYKNPIRKVHTSYTPFDFVQCVNSDTLAVAYNYIDRIEYYSVANNKLQPLFYMGSNEDQSELKSYKDLKQYYVDITSDAQHFYCLKSSCGLEEGDTVEIYGRDGSGKALYSLGRVVESIRADKQGYLVGYASNEEKTILYRFKL